MQVFYRYLIGVMVIMASGQVLAQEDLARVGYLVLSPLADKPSPERVAFIQGLRDRGYEEGRNLTIAYRSANGDPEALPFLADQLVEQDVQVIFAIGLQAARAASAATRSVPLVMMTLSDPVGEGLANSLASPGGNATGIALVGRELAAKRLELLKEAVPTVSRVAVVWQSTEPGSAHELAVTEHAARRLSLQIQPIDVAGEPDFSRAFQRIRQTNPDALLTILDQRTASYREIIPEFALRERLPSIFGLTGFVEAGGLMSYSPDIADMFRRSGSYVARILRGARAADLPIEQPSRYTLVVNLRTARAIGISLPDRILQRADKVIE